MSAQVIGYLGENGVRDVRIPIGHLLDRWPDLSPMLVMVPVGGTDSDAYPVDFELDGADLVWHVSDADTAVPGTTKAAVRMFSSDGRVGLDEPFEVLISPNLSAGGEPPVAIKPWIDKLVTEIKSIFVVSNVMPSCVPALWFNTDPFGTNAAVASLLLEDDETGSSVQVQVGDETYGVTNGTVNQTATKNNFDFTVL